MDWMSRFAGLSVWNRLGEKLSVLLIAKHVMPYLWGSDRLRVVQVRQEQDHSHLRWTVDVAEDLELVRQIYVALYPSNPAFTTDDIMQLLGRRPALATLNTE